MKWDGAIVGDRVRVCGRDGIFNGGMEGTVKHMPQNVGDSWIVWADDGMIYHIQNYEMIAVLNRKADVNPKGTK